MPEIRAKTTVVGARRAIEEITGKTVWFIDVEPLILSAEEMQKVVPADFLSLTVLPGFEKPKDLP